MHKSSVFSSISAKEKTRISTHCIHLKLFDMFINMLLNTIYISTYSLFFHCTNYVLFLYIYTYANIPYKNTYKVNNLKYLMDTDILV